MPMLRLIANDARARLGELLDRRNPTLVLRNVGGRYKSRRERASLARAKAVGFVVPLRLVKTLTRKGALEATLRAEIQPPKKQQAPKGKAKLTAAQAREAEKAAKRLIRYHQLRPTPKRSRTHKVKKAVPVMKPEAA